jgi:uncharacterized protein YpuA (DUF1002 family)
MNSKNDISRITVDIPKSDHRKLKALAALEGKSMREIIIESIEKRLANQQANTEDNSDLKKVVEDVLKKYAPALEKLAKS